jgi:hypothetical protein
MEPLGPRELLIALMFSTLALIGTWATSIWLYVVRPLADVFGYMVVLGLIVHVM